MARSFKKIEVKLELLTDTDMLLVVEKGIREGIHRGIQQKLITTTLKIMIEIKNRHILNIAI